MSEARLKFKPKLEKIVELLLYLAHKRPDADQYQAVKFLYLADREHLNRYGRPITFETYFALPFGPVATHALDMLENDGTVLRKAHIDSLPFEIEKLGKMTLIRAPKRAVNHEVFSKSDLKVFDEILKKYGHMSFDELYKLTHSHFAYKNAWDHRRGGTKRAEMKYEDMVEEGANKANLIEEFESVAEHM
jgi:uncharacterized phage-associated protein